MSSGELTVQILPHDIRGGGLPPIAVGGTLDVAPAVYAGCVRTVRAGGEPARIDEFGCVRLEGEIVGAMLDPGTCECRVDVLDADGRLFPLNWAGVEARGGRVHVEGSLYLEPELAAGTPHGEAVALSRRHYRVSAVRRYVWTSGGPVGPAALAAIPAPGEASDGAVYVAALVVAPDAELVPVP